MKFEKELKLESQTVEMTTNAHFMKKHILPKRVWIDSQVMIAFEKGKMELCITAIDNKVDISAGGISITINKSDFMKEIARFLVRETQK
jgi:hypothetical protein